ncbi:hypothetical protein [Roseicella aerolata]|uniref:Transmembrane protein n=1 Tax=Roseicella aerolata TaxID=2883479 RepID=A0A9X1IIV1_9PROT|nr:hypothetical protein [Roseicella aerolata]MCB4825454.1 hypothetical protein [Roseicella aerolata]
MLGAARMGLAGAGARPVALALPRLVWIAIALALTIPLLATSLPPLVDLPNHLARIHVLAGLATDPVLARMFEANWSLIPNLAMDLLLVPLVQWLPLYDAGRLFVAAAILVPVFGCVALHRAWWGGQDAWPWISALMAYNALLQIGLLNYVLDIGVALLGAAWTIREVRSGPLAWLLAALWGVACLLSHLVAFGLLVMVAGAGVLVRDRSSPSRLLGQVPLFAAMAGVPAALHLLFGPEGSGVGGLDLAEMIRQTFAHGLPTYLKTRVKWLVSPFASPVAWLALPTGLLFLAIIGLALLRRRLAVAPAAILAGGTLALAFFLLPAWTDNNGLVFQRLGVPLALVAVAGLRPSLPPRLAQATLTAGVLLLAGQGAATSWKWHDQERLLRDMRAAIAPIEPGARVLAVRDGTSPWHVEPQEGGAQRMLFGSIAYTHLPAVVLIERNAFFPMIFAAKGRQPLAVAPAYASLHQVDGHLSLTPELVEAEHYPPATEPCAYDPHQPVQCKARAWPIRYDYVLRLNAGATAMPDHPRLRHVAGEGFAQLYRVIR